MNTLQDIQHAIGQLPFGERVTLLEWVLESSPLSYHVAESAPAYAAAPAGVSFMTVDEYLKWEEHSPINHEYIAGQIFAMTTPVLRHQAILGNLHAAFHAHLKGGPCKAYVSNIKVQLKVDRADIVYCPDVLVACGPQEMEQPIPQDSRLIVEVLSPSTQSIDRREKLLNYRFIPSLEEYVIVAQRTQCVTVHRRSEEWRPIVAEAPDAGIEFRSIGLTLALTSLYEGTL